MTPRNEQVTPAPFEAAAPTAPPAPEPPAQGAPRWVLPALGALLLVAAGVVFWLPGQVDTSIEPNQVVDGEASPAVEGPAAAKPSAQQGAERPAEASPWSDAQLAKLRKEAQDALAELLDVQLLLEERAVELWAADAFAEATAVAAEADALYREREFEAATERYLQGRDAMQTLLDSVPLVVDRALDRATDAIEAGEREDALAALELAERIEAENARLPGLKLRADALEQLLPLLQQAADAEAQGDLAAAEQALQQATGLDPEHRRAAAELERVSALYVQQQFNDAMSDGYSALDESRFSAARKYFRRAEGLQPGSAEAASALRETESAEIASRLAALKRSGSSHEAGEQWQDAVKAYEAAEKIDPNVLFAREGLERSRPRAQLDRQFRKAIAEPKRLTDVAVAEVVEKLLAQARTLEPRGPVLKQQISRLDELLRMASTPIQLTLRSDMETEVTLYKVRRLGRFDQTSLNLRPGEYTAVGTRIGYRDVRKTFTLSHDSANPPIVIACTEPI